jgi:coenzyme F420-0:L-glutamate ligase / coenzyme F420-1:gamma-L-glutamate ligase
MSAAPSSLTLTALRDIPEVLPGSDLAALLAQALARAGLELRASDVLVIAQKIVSKAEGRYVRLAEVVPGERAAKLATVTGKDARLIELILAESTEVLRAQRGLLIVRHRLGLVMANAGIDRSNVAAGADERVLLLPRDPEASAQRLRAALAQRSGTACGLIISDSFGRAWRRGVVNVAIAAAGVTALLDRRGAADRAGRPLEVTEVALADALAAAAGLVLGEAAEGTPAVLVRGFACAAAANPATALIRPLAEDLFR